MPQEHQPLHQQSNERHSAELEAAASERLKETELSSEKLSEHVEKQAEQVESARRKIEKHEAKPEPAPAAEAESKPTFTARFIDRAASYRDTIASVQRKLPPVSREFSKFIHTPAVDKASEALENTVMRPSVALGAGLTAIIVGSFFYYFARTYGYSMRGSEIVVALVVGGFLGLVAETVVRNVRPNR